MKTTPNPQFGLLDSLTTELPPNEFLERLERTLDWKPIEEALQALYPATVGRPPCPPIVLFKMSLLQHCYGLSDPQCEELTADRLSWRKFVGLGLQERVPDETTLVRFRQRLLAAGLQEKMLRLVNEQLERRGLILKRVTLVDATLLQAARRAPSRGADGEKQGGDPDADYAARPNKEPHYGYKAHVGVDEKHTMIREAHLTAASVHDSQEFERMVVGDERMVVADKAYDSARRRAWLRERGIGDGLLRKAQRGTPLSAAWRESNAILSAVRSGIEKVFGWWKRSAGYRRVRYQGRDPNRLELEFKCIAWNLKRLTALCAA
jgi:IS5 family transposase